MIVDGTVADAAALVALDERNFKRADRFDRRLWRTILSGRVARNKLLTLVARHQGAVVGAIVGEFSAAADRLVVWSIAVDEAHRGAGLAWRLMADLVRRTRPPTRWSASTLGGTTCELDASIRTINTGG